jgi:hypothetical protein
MSERQKHLNSLIQINNEYNHWYAILQTALFEMFRLSSITGSELTKLTISHGEKYAREISNESLKKVGMRTPDESAPIVTNVKDGGKA